MAEVIWLKHLLLKNLKKVLEEELPKRFSKGDRVAVKLHMGEWGNLYYIRPPIAEVVVSALKKAGAEPFLFDTPTAYEGSRHTTRGYLETARKNGFSQETMGCPVIVSNEGVPVKSRYVQKMELARQIKEADGMLVLSHFKGHELANWGGAIKNLGMGAFTKESKESMHKAQDPQVSDKCTACGTCAGLCPMEAIEIREGKAVIGDSCFGCGVCADNCPEGAITLKAPAVSRIIAEAASFAVKSFEPRKVFYVNVVMDISRVCDCLPIGDEDAGPVVSPDVGILVSDNIVSIDRASLELVQKATNNEFGKLFRSRLTEQLDSAKEFGLGSGDYILKEL